MNTISIQPIVYDQTLEHLEIQEEQTTNELISILHDIAETVFKNSHHARRGVHAKGHALVAGEIRILENLPEIYRQGLFAEAKIYPVLMRYSTIPGDMLDDYISLPRGLGLKIVGVSGRRLAEYSEDVTQDFLFVNGPAFAAPSAKKFKDSLKLFAKTTDYPQILKKLVAFTARIFKGVIAMFNGQCPLLNQLGAYPATNVLSDTYFTQAPILYDQYIAKLQLVPVSSNLIALKDHTLDLSAPDALRNAANAFLSSQTAEWELRTQLCVDAKTMPIEDASIEWSQEQSPYVAVARIKANPQFAWDEERATLEDILSFNPWRSLTAHQPLGSIMRVRRRVYLESARYRMQANNVSLRDPRSVADLPKH